MKINITNRDKITAALQDAQSSYKARLMSAEYFYDVANNSIVSLNAMLPKKYQTGAKLTISTDDTVPNNYRYQAEKTQVTIERFKIGWFLVDVRRVDCPNAAGGFATDNVVKLHVSEEQKQIMANQIVQRFHKTI